MSLRIAFYGSSLLSSYWNGAATYYRGMLRALSELGYDIVFHEPDVLERQAHRDIDPPPWCRVNVYPGTADGLRAAAAQAAEADVVVKTSGVGFEDDRLLVETMRAARPGALRVFWDVDAPATLAEIGRQPEHPLRRVLPEIDLVLTYGGGDPVVRAYRELGARLCRPIYNALDPETHRPAPPDPRFAAVLSFLGNRLPDREARVEEFFLAPARSLPRRRFVLGGLGWEAGALPPNVTALGHVATRDHNAFNASARLVLNIARESMARTGFSPATRVFEAAGAGACLVTDAWEGVERFLKPGSEALVARDGADVAELVRSISPEKARRIGARARARALAEHTYARRAREADALFRQAMAASRETVR